MRLRWSVILPVIGLVLFVAVSYHSMRVNHMPNDRPSKYYWWSSLRLDTDPLNENPNPANPCQNEKENCGNWDPGFIGVEPAWLDRVLVFSAFPAFLAGTTIVAGLSKLGVDEVLTFMVSMPILLFGWYYFVGWLIERLLYKRTQKKKCSVENRMIHDGGGT